MSARREQGSPGSSARRRPLARDDRSPWPPVAADTPAPGALLRRRRRELDLSLSQVALALGYTNLPSATFRLSQCERGAKRPSDSHFPLLDQCLALADGTVAGWWSAMDRLVERRNEVGWLIVKADRELIGAHYQLLRARRSQILARPDWSNIRVEASRLSVSSPGWHTLTVGELLRGWDDGHLVRRSATGVAELVISAAGSAFSGLRSVDTIAVSSEPATTRLTALGVLRGVTRPRPPRAVHSLGHLLSRLSASVPDVLVRGNDGAIVARYKHASKTLTDPQGRKLARAASSRWRTSHRLKGAHGQTSGLAAGTVPGRWSAGRLELEPDMVYEDGRLSRGGVPVLWLDSAPRLDLIPVLFALLTSGEPGHLDASVATETQTNLREVT